MVLALGRSEMRIRQWMYDRTVKVDDKEQATLLTVEPLTLKEVQELIEPQQALIEYFVTAHHDSCRRGGGVLESNGVMHSTNPSALQYSITPIHKTPADYHREFSVSAGAKYPPER